MLLSWVLELRRRLTSIMAGTQVPTDLRRLDIFPLDLDSITLMYCSKVCIYLVSPTGLPAGVPYVDGAVSAIFDGRHSTGSSTFTGCEGLGPRPLFLCSLHELPFEHDDRQHHGSWESFVADGTKGTPKPKPIGFWHNPAARNQVV